MLLGTFYRFRLRLPVISIWRRVLLPPRRCGSQVGNPAVDHVAGMRLIIKSSVFAGRSNKRCSLCRDARNEEMKDAR
jgi:hypothetical protein